MNLIVDAGNTRVKLAVFEKDTLVEVIFIDENELLSEIKKILKKYKITAGILSNVGFIAEYKMQKLQNSSIYWYYLHHKCSFQ